MPLTQVSVGGIATSAVTADSIAQDAVTVADIPDGEITGGKLHSTIDLPDAATAHTQNAGTNNTTIATTEFVTTAIDAIDQDAIVTPQAAQNSRSFSTGNNHLMAGDVTIGENQTYTLSGTAKLIIIG